MKEILELTTWCERLYLVINIIVILVGIYFLVRIILTEEMLPDKIIALFLLAAMIFFIGLVVGLFTGMEIGK